MLYPINMANWNGKLWCGPSALTALTGIDLGQAHSRFAFITGDRIEDVESVSSYAMKLALSEANMNVRRLDLNTRYPNRTHGITLRRYMTERPFEERAFPLLIRVEDHYITAHMDYLIDNGNPNPTHISNFPKLGRLVKEVWIVTKRVE